MIDPNIPADRYHADALFEQPSLSASISGIIYGKSPLHAWYAHPKLNPHYQPDYDRKFDLGTCAHSVFLEGHHDNIVPLDFPDWRTKASKEAADAARSVGKTPILKRQMDKVLMMARAAEAFLKTTKLNGVLARGKPEVTITHETTGIHMRSRLDWLTDDREIILDLKTTENAKPESFIRGPMRGLHYDLKAEFYKRMVRLETGVEPTFVWLCQEVEPPFACSLVGMAPSMSELGVRKMEIATELWRHCIESNKWPAYGDQIAHAEAEDWQIANVLEREVSGLDW